MINGTSNDVLQPAFAQLGSDVGRGRHGRTHVDLQEDWFKIVCHQKVGSVQLEAVLSVDHLLLRRQHHSDNPLPDAGQDSLVPLVWLSYFPEGAGGINVLNLA